MSNSKKLNWASDVGRLGEGYKAVVRKLFILFSQSSDGRLLPIDDFGETASVDAWESLPMSIEASKGGIIKATRGGFEISAEDDQTLRLSFAIRNSMTSPAQVDRVTRAVLVTDAERSMGIFAPDGPGDVKEMMEFDETMAEGSFWDRTTDDDDEIEMYRKRTFSAADFKEYYRVNKVNAMAAMLYSLRASPSLTSIVSGLVEEAREQAAAAARNKKQATSQAAAARR